MRPVGGGLGVGICSFVGNRLCNHVYGYFLVIFKINVTTSCWAINIVLYGNGCHGVFLVAMEIKNFCSHEQRKSQLPITTKISRHPLKK